ncbi:uncharacterized protein LOC106477190, partial [Limulus polyphemus]|uniref:Uncharacterized protein LOC106477190 n=1 Tax=Limulus polyphemus TaxID=6850 RepID=A0ABM1C2V8_LIMPO
MLVFNLVCTFNIVLLSNMEAVNIIWWCALYLHLLAGGSLTAANTRWKRQDLLYPAENTQSKANGISECLTHKNTKGSCRDVTMCEVLQAEIQRGLHPNICEWKGIIPIVCCPLSPTVTPVTTITTQSPANDRGCARVPVTISPAEFRREEAKGNPAKAGYWPWM